MLSPASRAFCLSLLSQAKKHHSIRFFVQSTLDQVPGARDLAANYDRLGTETDDQVRNTDTELPCSLDERGFRIRFTSEGAVHHLNKRRLLRSSGQLQITCNRRTLGRESFPTVRAATRTWHGCAAADDHVSKLTRRSALTTID